MSEIEAVAATDQTYQAPDGSLAFAWESEGWFRDVETIMTIVHRESLQTGYWYMLDRVIHPPEFDTVIVFRPDPWPDGLDASYKRSTLRATGSDPA